MFENLVECARNKQQNNKWKYFLLTSTAWSLALAAAIAGGIYFYDAHLDEQFTVLAMLTPVPPPPAPPVGHPSPAHPNVSNAPRMLSDRFAVENPPKTIEQPKVEHASYVDSDKLNSAKMDDVGSLYGQDDGTGKSKIGVVNSVGPDTDTAANHIPPPPPLPEKQDKPKQPTMIRRSEGVIRGLTVSQVVPEYPGLARTAHVTGAVQVEITIGEDGSVLSAHVVSGHPLLQQAALTAAHRWRFNPTLLNNTPVKVTGVLTFNFTM